MLVTKATQRRFSMNLADLPSCIPTQVPVVLFNPGLYCPFLDIRFDVSLEFALANWRRLASIFFRAFSVLALVLAAVGLYSVVSCSVVQRPMTALRCE